MAADDEGWRASRREAFEVHAQAQRRAEAAESERARPLVADFVRRAREQGLALGPLRARAYSGSATYRTGLIGWYLQPIGPLAIGDDGQFYMLIAAPGLTARLRGVDVVPEPPPLAVGRGARDGGVDVAAGPARAAARCGERFSPALIVGTLTAEADRVRGQSGPGEGHTRCRRPTGSGRV